MKYLGIDYGTKRIGIALSDDDGVFAFPYRIVSMDATAVSKIESLVKEMNVATIVIGESLASNGLPNLLVEQTKRFKQKLIEATGVSVVFEREDFSTVEAHRYQVSAGKRDDSAAAIILQRYLDKVSLKKD